MPLSPGQILNNRYRIVQQLGVGGFGAVYKAMDIHLKVSCAVKENFDTSPEAERQFAREANILATLHHPNLPRVTDHFSLPGQGQYLVMDFVEGQDLEKVMEQAKQQAKGPLPEAQVLEWAEQVCAALAYLHAHQPPVIHRDIKPANIRLTPGGKAMLVDFGIAKFYDPKQRTTQGARAVTPGFSPPEQYGQKSTDGRTDIYALGATLYMLLSGQAPPESIERVTGTPLPPLRSLNPAVSPQTEQVVHTAMALLPDDRYASILDLAAALSGQTVSLPAAQSGSQPLVTQILPGTPGYPGALASSQTPATTLPPGYHPGTPPTGVSGGLPRGRATPAAWQAAPGARQSGPGPPWVAAWSPACCCWWSDFSSCAPCSPRLFGAEFERRGDHPPHGDHRGRPGARRTRAVHPGRPNRPADQKADRAAGHRHACAFNHADRHARPAHAHPRAAVLQRARLRPKLIRRRPVRQPPGADQRAAVPCLRQLELPPGDDRHGNPPRLVPGRRLLLVHHQHRRRKRSLVQRRAHLLDLHRQRRRLGGGSLWLSLQPPAGQLPHGDVPGQPLHHHPILHHPESVVPKPLIPIYPTPRSNDFNRYLSLRACLPPCWR